MYDDGDVEHRVPLRFIQLLDKQPKGSGSGRGLKRKGCSSGRAELPKGARHLLREAPAVNKVLLLMPIRINSVAGR